MSRGLMASYLAAQRRSERDAAKRYKAMVAQQANLAKQSELARAEYDVQLQESYLETIVSLHRDAGTFWHWPQVAATPPPPRSAENEQTALRTLQEHLARPPQASHLREAAAQHALASHDPSFGDRILGKAATQRATLEAAVVAARAADEAEWRATYAAWEQRRALFESAVARAREQDTAAHGERHAQWEWLKNIAQGMLQRDIRYYSAVLEHLAPFDELEALGANVNLRVKEPWYVEAFVTVRDADIVPRNELKLLASGRLSTKEMQKAKYWAYYQDYVCSAALRVGREVFHLLPIEKAYVSVGTPMLDTATGHDAVQTVLSVELTREKLLGLNFDRIDASDAVDTFERRMSFKKTTGFAVVDVLQPTSSLMSVG